MSVEKDLQGLKSVEKVIATNTSVIKPFNRHEHIRSMERTISDVIKIINKWRELYNGSHVPDANGRLVFKSYSLIEAAAIIKVPKRSLDDYLLQLRFGNKFGFDFVNRGHEKMGVLRTYVRKHRLEALKREGKTKIQSID